MRVIYPFAYRRAIESCIRKGKHAFLKADYPNDDSCAAVYRVAENEFFFKIHGFREDADGHYGLVSYYPENAELYKVRSGVKMHLHETESLFKTWLDHTEAVMNYIGPFEYTRFYEIYDNEFFKKNRFYHEKEYEVPLTSEAQERTVLFLDFIKEKIDVCVQLNPNDELERVSKDIPQTVENIGGFTKSEIFKLITRYLSVIRKHSRSLLKEVMRKYTINKALLLIDKGADIAVKVLREVI